MLENASTYLELAASSMTEEQFLSAVAVEADCGILLDLNNVYVSAFNHDRDASAFLRGLPLERIGQLHIAGHTHRGTHIVDTHWVRSADRLGFARRVLAACRPRRVAAARVGQRDPGVRARPRRSVPRQGVSRLAATASGKRGTRMSATSDDAPEHLAHVQRWLQQAITHPRSTHDEVDRIVRPSSRMSALERLGVYQDAYFARLLECLADDYPALRLLLGRERFSALCRRYIAHYPPRAPSLNDYGKALPEFCTSAAVAHLFDATPAPAYSATLLRDLARIEWASVELIHAPSTPSLTADEILARQADFGNTTLVAAPSVRVLQLEHPVHALYLALRAGRSADAPLPAPAVAFHLLRRADWQITHTDLDVAEGELLASVVSGAPLATALAAATERGVSESAVTGYFQHWLSLGLFTACHLAG